MSPTILHETRDHVLRLTLNRPDKRNALSPAMYGTLADALRQAGHDGSTRVVLLRGQPGAFCSGNDIETFLGESGVEPDHPVFRFMRALAECAVPVVAALDGVAVGIGATLLLHCDLVYASPRTRVQFPFARLGLCPEFGSSLLLSRLAGRVRAAEALLLGEPIAAAKACEWGLINEVIPESALDDHAWNRAHALALLDPDATRTTRRLMQTADAAQLAATMADEQAEFLRMLAKPSVQQGFREYLESRKARS